MYYKQPTKVKGQWLYTDLYLTFIFYNNRPTQHWRRNGEKGNFGHIWYIKLIYLASEKKVFRFASVSCYNTNFGHYPMF